MSTKKTFIREFSEINLSKLNDSDLYRRYLNPDIFNKEGKKRVFPAFRNGRLDFYYDGGKLFSFNGDFITHIKYASVLKYKMDYISEIKFQNVLKVKSFTEGYKEIKDNCSLYAKEEAKGVSKLYSKYSYLDSTKDIVVLDIEIQLNSPEDSLEYDNLTLKRKSRQKRLDILLFNKSEKTLRFYEAKHFSNKELWSELGHKPPVCKQIRDYERTIKDSMNEIKEAYKNYASLANKVFKGNRIDIPDNVVIEPWVGLLIFGYDSSQLKKIKKLLIEDRSLEDINCYRVGNIAECKIENMWAKTKRLEDHKK